MGVVENYHRVLKEISEIVKDPQDIRLVAVSKGVPWDKAKAAFDAGCRDFGESKVQEAVGKIEQAPREVRWHFIGPLQKNKVRKIINRCVLIHSVDSFELAKKISECSFEMNCITQILLQSNTSGEESKQGLSPGAWKEIFLSLMYLPGISIQGFMTMAPLTGDEKVIRNCFSSLAKLREECKQISNNHLALPYLSMGMSHDYKIALSEGANLLRIGSAIFSEKI